MYTPSTEAVVIDFLDRGILFQSCIGGIGTIKVYILVLPKPSATPEPQRQIIYHMYQDNNLLGSYTSMSTLESAAAKLGITPIIKSGFIENHNIIMFTIRLNETVALKLQQYGYTSEPHDSFFECYLTPGQLMDIALCLNEFCTSHSFADFPCIDGIIDLQKLHL
jgi:hypothetical protein